MIRSLNVPCRWSGIIRRHESVKGSKGYATLSLCIPSQQITCSFSFFGSFLINAQSLWKTETESTGNSYLQPVWVKKVQLKMRMVKVYTTSSSQLAISWYVMWIVSTQLEGCRDAAMFKAQHMMAWTNHIQCSGRAQSPDPALHLALQSQTYNTVSSVTVSSLSGSVQHVPGMRLPQAIVRCALNRAASLHLCTY